MWLRLEPKVDLSCRRREGANVCNLAAAAGMHIPQTRRLPPTLRARLRAEAHTPAPQPRRRAATGGKAAGPTQRRS